MAKRSLVASMTLALALATALTGCAGGTAPQTGASSPGGTPPVSGGPSAVGSSAAPTASSPTATAPESTAPATTAAPTAAATKAPQNPLPPNATQIDPCSYVPLRKVDSLHQVSYVTLSDGDACVVSAPQRGEFRVTVTRGAAGQTPPATLLAGIPLSSFTALTTAPPAVRNGMVASQPSVAAAYGSTANGSLVVVVGKQTNGQQRLATGTTDILAIVAEGL